MSDAPTKKPKFDWVQPPTKGMSGRKDEFRTVSDWFMDRWLDEDPVIKEGAMEDILDYFPELTREMVEDHVRQRNEEAIVASYVAPPLDATHTDVAEEIMECYTL